MQSFIKFIKKQYVNNHISMNFKSIKYQFK